MDWYVWTKVLTTNPEHVLTHQETHALKQPPLELINQTFINMSSDPTLLRVGKNKEIIKYLFIHTHTHTYIYIHIYIHTYINTHTHTHIYTQI